MDFFKKVMTHPMVCVNLWDETMICRRYHKSDPIWKLEHEKRQRQVIADVQRDLVIEADRRAQEQVNVRG